tara:strand:+ start:10749 stop:11042 length:294 start_codon:yes stop_codon:yes gene_type:complete
MLADALFMITLGVVNTGISRNPPTNTGTPKTQSGEPKHRHPQGAQGKDPRRYLEHNIETQQASEPAKAVRPGPPPGKAPCGYRREVKKIPFRERCDR